MRNKIFVGIIFSLAASQSAFAMPDAELDFSHKISGIEFFQSHNTKQSHTVFQLADITDDMEGAPDSGYDDPPFDDRGVIIVPDGTWDGPIDIKATGCDYIMDGYYYNCTA